MNKYIREIQIGLAILSKYCVNFSHIPIAAKGYLVVFLAEHPGTNEQKVLVDNGWSKADPKRRNVKPYTQFCWEYPTGF